MSFYMCIKWLVPSITGRNSARRHSWPDTRVYYMLVLCNYEEKAICHALFYRFPKLCFKMYLEFESVFYILTTHNYI